MTAGGEFISAAQEAVAIAKGDVEPPVVHIVMGDPAMRWRVLYDEDICRATCDAYPGLVIKAPRGRVIIELLQQLASSFISESEARQ